jgi:hypothetical protein
MVFYVVALGVLLSACAGHSLECETGTSVKDCAPGTAGHERLLQRQADTKTVDAMDDARCRAYAQPGTEAYRACRRRADADRQRYDPH